MSLYDTIAAIATPPGESGIGVIRISGGASLRILKKIFKTKDFKPLHAKFYYGHFIDPKTKEIIDDGYAVYFKNPKSYTAEDLVEINCHGNSIVLQKILKIILNNGARLAFPGEFTRRAFLNHRIDLVQAEAIAELINAKSEKQLRIARNKLDGKFSDKLKNIKANLIEIASLFEAYIDFPEENIPVKDKKKYLFAIDEITNLIKKYISTYKDGSLISTGAKIAIVGKPNVGKSSLLNLLLEEDRAIVTEIPGTTRDLVHGDIEINGIRMTLFDSAGIFEAKDRLDKLSVKKSEEIIKDADLILFVCDVEQGFTKEDEIIFERIKNHNHIGIVNKVDIYPPHPYPSPQGGEGLKIFPLPLGERGRGEGDRYLPFSAKKKTGLKKLEQKIIAKLFNKKILNEETDIITNLRHKEALAKTSQALLEAKNAIKDDLSPEFISVHLRESLNYLSELTGEITTDDLLNNIFSRFCIGK